MYFTDPPYGLQEGFNDLKIELDFAGVFKLSAKGVLTLLETDLKQTMPNGIGLSPDETKLYIGNSGVGENIFWMDSRSERMVSFLHPDPGDSGSLHQMDKNLE